MNCGNDHPNPDGAKYCAECGLRLKPPPPVRAPGPLPLKVQADEKEAREAALEGVANLDKIERIVVLMQENRSFDHMLGYLSLPELIGRNRQPYGGRDRTDVEGLQTTFSNPGLAGERVPIRPLKDTVFYDCPGHSRSRTAAQIAGGSMSGFVQDFAEILALSEGCCLRHESIGQIMGYHTARTVPVYDFFARNFTVCDHWFSAAPGPTWVNRMFLYAGTSNGLSDNGHPGLVGKKRKGFLAYSPKMPETLIVDELEKAKNPVKWRLYRGNAIPWMALFPSFKENHGRVMNGDKVRPFSRFDNDCKRGDLPPVVFIDGKDPALRERAVPGNANTDDLAPSDVARGQEFIGKVYETLREHGLLASTLFVVTYDEHGGFYDHVAPPLLPTYLWEDDEFKLRKLKELEAELDELSGLAKDQKLADNLALLRDRAKLEQGFRFPAFTTYGVRVPAMVISPYVEAASVGKTPMDHTSITHTILLKFCDRTQQMPTRVHVAPNLGALLTRSTARTGPELPSAAEAVAAARRVRSRRRPCFDPPDFLELRGLREAIARV
jgi:phospholipase C